jgi:hypothetical protein
MNLFFNFFMYIWRGKKKGSIEDDIKEGPTYAYGNWYGLKFYQLTAASTTGAFPLKKRTQLCTPSWIEGRHGATDGVRHVPNTGGHAVNDACGNTGGGTGKGGNEGC